MFVCHHFSGEKSGKQNGQVRECYLLPSFMFSSLPHCDPAIIPFSLEDCYILHGNGGCYGLLLRWQIVIYRIVTVDCLATAGAMTLADAMVSAAVVDRYVIFAPSCAAHVPSSIICPRARMPDTLAFFA